jgi:hypothetical protein
MAGASRGATSPLATLRSLSLVPFFSLFLGTLSRELLGMLALSVSLEQEDKGQGESGVQGNSAGGTGACIHASMQVVIC